jgi:hypothetical protein
MTSLIDTQVVTIERVIVPSGKGIASNSSPSLSPILGSLAQDVANPGSLYVGDGVSWNSSSAGATGVTSSSTQLAPATYSSLGVSPDLTNVVIYLQKIQMGTGNFSTVNLNVVLDQTINLTVDDDWVNLLNSIPASYRPTAGDVYFPVSVIGAGGTIGTLQGAMSTAGNLSIASRSGALGLSYFGNFSCSYIV